MCNRKDVPGILNEPLRKGVGNIVRIRSTKLPSRSHPAANPMPPLYKDGRAASFCNGQRCREGVLAFVRASTVLSHSICFRCASELTDTCKDAGNREAAVDWRSRMITTEGPIPSPQAGAQGCGKPSEGSLTIPASPVALLQAMNKAILCPQSCLSRPLTHYLHMLQTCLLSAGGTPLTAGDQLRVWSRAWQLSPCWQQHLQRHAPLGTWPPDRQTAVAHV